MNVVEVKKYQVANKVFDTLIEAELYLEELENMKLLIIKTSPDLREGKYEHSKKHIFTVYEDKETMRLGQDTETLCELVDHVFSMKLGKYSGVMNTIQLMPNFTVNSDIYKNINVIMDKSNNSINIISHKNLLYINQLPYQFDSAIDYVIENIYDKIYKL